MTVIMKTVAKPTNIVNANILESQLRHIRLLREEEKIEIQPDPPKRSGNNTLCCILLSALLVVFCGFVVGLMLYEQFMRPTVHHYKGFCSIPTSTSQRLSSSKQWTSYPDTQVISTEPEPVGENFVNALREELDLGDTLEKISVINNGHRVNFLHDFTDNTTGIVDEKRCFIMDLAPEVVLSPELFIAGLQSGGEFELSRVRTDLHAAIPALRELSIAANQLAADCFPRPIYRLYRKDGTLVRKRSVEDPDPDYVQFAGKHVQEIKIHNLADILDYEKKNDA